LSRHLKIALSLTDIAFLMYWAMAGLDIVGLVTMPNDWLYPNAHDPRVVAWNWSFFPLDIAFSVTGLWAVAASRKGDAIWRPLALISLILTIVAGAMACGYWLLIGELDVVWFGANALLIIWPCFFLSKLVCDLGGNNGAVLKNAH
jgi:hypothetical protein